MIGQLRPKPSFWRAWFASLIFIVPSALVVEALWHPSAWIVVIVAVVASYIIAFQAAHAMPYDAESQWNINYAKMERRFREPQDPPKT